MNLWGCDCGVLCILWCFRWWYVIVFYFHFLEYLKKLLFFVGLIHQPTVKRTNPPAPFSAGMMDRAGWPILPLHPFQPMSKWGISQLLLISLFLVNLNTTTSVYIFKNLLPHICGQQACWQSHLKPSCHAEECSYICSLEAKMSEFHAKTPVLLWPSYSVLHPKSEPQCKNALLFSIIKYMGWINQIQVS